MELRGFLKWQDSEQTANDKESGHWMPLMKQRRHRCEFHIYGQKLRRGTYFAYNFSGVRVYFLLES